MIYKEKWYSVAKIIAESDSIGEGYQYCKDYTLELFESNDEKYGYRAAAKEILDLLGIEEKP